MKKIELEGKPHLCLFAMKDINNGEEITYDYGGHDLPWRSRCGQETCKVECFQILLKDYTNIIQLLQLCFCLPACP